MGINNELSALLRQVSAGEQLSVDERARLVSLLEPRKSGRPSRDDLKRVQDELGRALHFFKARAEGKGDGEAVNQAARAANASVRRIRGGVKWYCDLVGATSEDLIGALRWDADIARRVKVGGLEALTAKEVLLVGCTIAYWENLYEQVYARQLPEVVATWLVRHVDAFKAADAAVVDGTFAALQAMAQAGELPSEIANGDLAILVSAVADTTAKTQVQKLVEFLHHASDL